MRVCEVEGCEEQHRAKGFCMKHYYRVRRYGRTHVVRDGSWYSRKPGRPESGRRCDLPGCDRQHYAKNLCYMHWKQAWRMNRSSELRGKPVKRVPLHPLLPHLRECVDNVGGVQPAEKRLGLARGHLIRILDGYDSLNIDTADRICIALGLPFDALFPLDIEEAS